MKTDEKKDLRVSEWIFAGSLVLILSSLWLVAKIQTWQYSKGTTSSPIELVSVQIEGFVKRPNVYEFPVGTPLREALRKARPKRFADLRCLDPMAPILGPMKLTIKSLQSVKIHITGAVAKNEILEVTPGTRICQLKERISLLQGADLSFFKKQRFVMDGEILEIPSLAN